MQAPRGPSYLLVLWSASDHLPITCQSPANHLPIKFPLLLVTCQLLPHPPSVSPAATSPHLAPSLTAWLNLPGLWSCRPHGARPAGRTPKGPSQLPVSWSPEKPASDHLPITCQSPANHLPITCRSPVNFYPTFPPYPPSCPPHTLHHPIQLN